MFKVTISVLIYSLSHFASTGKDSTVLMLGMSVFASTGKDSSVLVLSTSVFASTDIAFVRQDYV